jgi:anti-sigma-K factor RskA
MMPQEQEEREVLAAEYVLGTLDPDERAEASRLRGSDADFAAIVRAWERRLGELNSLVAPVEPPPEIWGRVRARVAAPESVVLPAAETLPAASSAQPPPLKAVPAEAESIPSPPSAPPTVAPEPEAAPAVAPGPEPGLPLSSDFAAAPLSAALRNADIGALERSRSRWRAAAAALLGVAVALAAFAALRALRPDVLPAALGPPVRTVEVTNRVEVPSARPAEFVAILSKDGVVSPGFLLTFDLDKRILAARAVDLPQYPGKNYQLWMTSPKLGRPQSLGAIGSREFTVKSELSAYDPSVINSATYSVSLEPAGAAPSSPSGPMIYSGKLIETAPVGFHDKAP